jgi:alkylation response protein AidB-like acyl-CoA dehydrogenase
MAVAGPTGTEAIAAARALADEVLAPNAAEIDRSRSFPRANFAALAERGLLGLLVPAGVGGSGGNLAPFAAILENLGRGCASTAMCYLMHGCATAVIAAKATPEQAERWLRPIAGGQLIGTLAFSERGTGAHFYNPEIQAHFNGGHVLNGRKSFVTSGGHADLYLTLVKASPAAEGLDVVVVEKGATGLSFDGSWDGLGMAGNSSVRMVLDNVAVPLANAIGGEGAGADLVFGVVAPTFLIGVAAVNVGIAQAALDAAIRHATTRTYPPDGKSLATIQAIQFYLAEMKIATDAARALVQRAAELADAADPGALPAVIEAKIAASDAVIAVTNQAMQVGGGQGYSRGMSLERHLRDARASAVMAPTTEVLKEWLGKILCGLPLF